MEQDRSTLDISEPHPAVYKAIEYLHSLGMSKLLLYLESFSSCAIEGNRLAEVCAGTLRRFVYSETYSDRYLLGLAWTIRNIEEKNEQSYQLG